MLRVVDSWKKAELSPRAKAAPQLLVVKDDPAFLTGGVTRTTQWIVFGDRIETAVSAGSSVSPEFIALSS